MTDLTLPQKPRRVNAWLTVLAIAGLGMVLIILADDNHWPLFGLLSIVFAYLLWVLGTAGYRLRQRVPGRVQVHSMLRLREVDLSEGYEVHRDARHLRTQVLAVGGKRIRILKGLGDPSRVDEWLHGASA